MQHAFKNGLNKPSSKIGKSLPKVIKQYSLDGQFIREWESITEAGKQLSIGRTSISRCCNNRTKTAGGYIMGFKVVQINTT